MKRIFSILFALCLIVALSLSVSAESTNKLTYAVEASASTVSANTEFTVLVKVTENTGICWFQAMVKYDSSVLTYVSASTDTSVFSGATIEVYSPKEGQVNVNLGGRGVLFMPNPEIYNQTGTLAALTFKVNEGASVGTTTISVDTIPGNAVKTVDSVQDFDYTITGASASIQITNNTPHTCVAGSATRENELAPTCTVDGSYDSVVRCTICNKELSRTKTTITKLGHTSGAETKENEIAATCNSVGSYESVVRCTVCNSVVTSSVVVVPATEDHTPGTAVKENEKTGDCKTASSYDSVVYCTVCNKEVSRTKVTGAKGNHVAGTPVVEYNDATCVKTGSMVTIYKCTVCGTEMSRETTEIAMTDHVKGSAVMENVVEATCVKTGSYVSVVRCVTCDKVLSSEPKTVEKAPHTPSAAVEENRKEPVNCGSAGSYESVVYCSVCNTQISRVTQSIPAPAHTPGPEATDTTPQICTVCNAILAPAKGHTHSWSTTLTSDLSGHWYACSGCSEKKDAADHVFDNNCDADCNTCGYTRTPADHFFGSWTVVEEATATTDGKRQRNCIICGTVESETIPATGETTAPDVTTDPVSPETSGEDVTTEQTPVTSDPDVTTESAPVTDPENTTGTVTPDVTEPEETDPDDDDGCGSVVSAGIALIAILGTAIIMKKRD